MKAKARSYKGIEFVTVHELPPDQQLLLKHATDPERIKILIDGVVLDNCIQYGQYCEWHATVYERSVAKSAAKPVQENTFAGIALDKV